MKYSRLTKEQFDSLSNEFSIFLASNAIDSKQWNKIKSSSIERADHILDIFSDLVWKNILHKVAGGNDPSALSNKIFKIINS